MVVPADVKAGLQLIAVDAVWWTDLCIPAGFEHEGYHNRAVAPHGTVGDAKVLLFEISEHVMGPDLDPGIADGEVTEGVIQELRGSEGSKGLESPVLFQAAFYLRDRSAAVFFGGCDDEMFGHDKLLAVCGEPDQMSGSLL